MTVAPGIQLEDVTFRIGAFAMEGLTLEVARGEYGVLTGPNGSGKTLLLKLVAGLIRPERGAIRIDGRDVTALPPWLRGVGALQQEGLLFPNRTVRDNIAFGLEVRGVPGDERARAVGAVAERLGLGPLLDRKPGGLSGGERQRASLARALVLKPSALLLDEPLSAIDETLRDEMIRELKVLQREAGLTVLHVAHNRREIDLLADRVVVMQGGRVISNQ